MWTNVLIEINSLLLRLKEIAFRAMFKGPVVQLCSTVATFPLNHLAPVGTLFFAGTLSEGSNTHMAHLLLEGPSMYFHAGAMGTHASPNLHSQQLSDWPLNKWLAGPRTSWLKCLTQGSGRALEWNFLSHRQVWEERAVLCSLKHGCLGVPFLIGSLNAPSLNPQFWSWEENNPRKDKFAPH